MKKKGKVTPKIAKAMKELDQIPDGRMKVFFKILLLAKESGIDVFKETGEKQQRQR